MHSLLIEISIIFWGIILLTILQKYHFQMLYYLTKRYHSFLRYIIKFIIRTGIIIHEVCHMFFWVLSWAKISKVELFRKDGGRVSFETKNYIWHLSKFSWHPWYMFQLFFNQIWIFLTSIGPLIFWIGFTYLVIFTLNINIWTESYSDIISSLELKEYWILLLYTIIIPSFILSFQDIKNFIISAQDTIGATIVWSFINTLIFMCFLAFLTFFFEYFLFFWIFYIIIFVMLFIFWSVNYIYFSFMKSKKTLFFQENKYKSKLFISKKNNDV